MSISLGRPRSIRLEDCNVKDPIDCDYPCDKTQEYPPVASMSGLPSEFTAHWFQYQVSLVMHELLSSGVHKAEGQNHVSAIDYHRRIGSMVQRLPLPVNDISLDSLADSSVPHLSVICMQVEVTANAFLLALYRRHSRMHRLNRSFAVDAALQLLAAQERLFRLMSRVPHTIFMLSYYSVDAGLYLAALLAGHSHDDPQLVEQIKQALRLAIERLSWMADKSKVAASGLLAIRRILRGTMRPRDGISGVPSRTNHAAYEATPLSPPTSGYQNLDSGSMEHVESRSNAADQDRLTTHDTLQDQQWPTPPLVYTFDPFMGVTAADYTVENFLSEMV